MLGDGVGPQSIKVEAEEVGLDGLEVEVHWVGEEVTSMAPLLAREVDGLLEPDPPGAYQNGFALGPQLRHLHAPDIVDCQSELGHQVEAIEDVERVGRVLGDEVEVWLPHVRAEELDHGAPLRAEPGEERLERLLGAPAADP